MHYLKAQRVLSFCGDLPPWSLCSTRHIAFIYPFNKNAKFHLEYQIMDKNMMEPQRYVRYKKEYIAHNLHMGIVDPDPVFFKRFENIWHVKDVLLFHWLVRVEIWQQVEMNISTHNIVAKMCSLYVYNSPGALGLYMVKISNNTKSYSQTDQIKCSTFQCYLLLECMGRQYLKHELEHTPDQLVTIIQQPGKYMKITKYLNITNTPLILNLNNFDKNGDISTGQEVRGYHPQGSSQYLSVHISFNHSVSQYNGQNCIYGGIHMLQKVRDYYFTRYVLCGSQVTFAIRFQNLITDNIYLVFYYYKEFGQIRAHIEIQMSPCAGIFLDLRRPIQCYWPIFCRDVHTKCLTHLISIFYPNDTCIKIQHLHDYLRIYETKLMISSLYIYHINSGNNVTLIHGPQSGISTSHIYERHKLSVDGSIELYEDEIIGGNITFSLDWRPFPYNSPFFIQMVHTPCNHKCTDIYKVSNYKSMSQCNICQNVYLANTLKYIAEDNTYSTLHFHQNCSHGFAVNVNVSQVKSNMVLHSSNEYTTGCKSISLYLRHWSQVSFTVPTGCSTILETSRYNKSLKVENHLVRCEVTYASSFSIPPNSNRYFGKYEHMLRTTITTKIIKNNITNEVPSYISWFEAESWCQREEAKLISLHSQREARELFDMLHITDRFMPAIYIGLQIQVNYALCKWARNIITLFCWYSA